VVSKSHYPEIFTDPCFIKCTEDFLNDIALLHISAVRKNCCRH